MPAPPEPREERPRAPEQLPVHPVRVALLDLLADGGTVTSTEAAARLGESSGLCSFHLRQLARHGLIEEAPHSGGRARPWRLRWERPREPEPVPDEPARSDEFGVLARGLEDESHRRWLAQRDHAPREWRADEAFSTVVHLTPQELRAVAAAVRATLDGYRHRDHDVLARPADARPVAFVSRLFPLLPGASDAER
ncbi:ArsR/SmtB family transcription factor [Streptomyces sp. NPDC087270]|uniref:ArsR/SmtB family transcription factor n=1 Tax=Streptomyces sp. NPDC087270 TaxID=3365774 RepID=UPI00382B323B